MLAVIGMALKVIGIIVAIITCVILLLVCCVLFIPVQYKICGKKTDSLQKLQACCSWMLFLVRVSVVYEDTVLVIVRVLGIPIYRIPSSNVKEEKPTNKKQKDKLSKKSNQMKATDEGFYGEEQREKIEKPVNQVQEPEENKACQHKTLRDIIKSSKIYRKWIEFKEMVTSIIKVITHYHDIWKLEITQTALGVCIQQLLFLYGKIKPRRIKGVIEYGSDDPATTGKLLAYRSILYPVVGGELVFIPYFDEVMMNAMVQVNGRIRVIHFVRVVIIIYRCKEFRQVLKQVTNKEGTKNGRAK